MRCRIPFQKATASRSHGRRVNCVVVLLQPSGFVLSAAGGTSSRAWRRLHITWRSDRRNTRKLLRTAAPSTAICRGGLIINHFLDLSKSAASSFSVINKTGISYSKIRLNGLDSSLLDKRENDVIVRFLPIETDQVEGLSLLLQFNHFVDDVCFHQ